MGNSSSRKNKSSKSDEDEDSLSQVSSNIFCAGKKKKRKLKKESLYDNDIKDGENSSVKKKKSGRKSSDQPPTKKKNKSFDLKEKSNGNHNGQEEEDPNRIGFPQILVTAPSDLDISLSKDEKTKSTASPPSKHERKTSRETVKENIDAAIAESPIEEVKSTEVSRAAVSRDSEKIPNESKASVERVLVPLDANTGENEHHDKSALYTYVEESIITAPSTDNDLHVIINTHKQESTNVELAQMKVNDNVDAAGEFDDFATRSGCGTPSTDSSPAIVTSTGQSLLDEVMLNVSKIDGTSFSEQAVEKTDGAERPEVVDSDLTDEQPEKALTVEENDDTSTVHAEVEDANCYGLRSDQIIDKNISGQDCATEEPCAEGECAVISHVMPNSVVIYMEEFKQPHFDSIPHLSSELNSQDTSKPEQKESLQEETQQSFADVKPEENSNTNNTFNGKLSPSPTDPRDNFTTENPPFDGAKSPPLVAAVAEEPQADAELDCEIQEITANITPTRKDIADEDWDKEPIDLKVDLGSGAMAGLAREGQSYRHLSGVPTRPKPQAHPSNGTKDQEPSRRRRRSRQAAAASTNGENHARPTSVEKSPLQSPVEKKSPPPPITPKPKSRGEKPPSIPPKSSSAKSPTEFKFPKTVQQQEPTVKERISDQPYKKASYRLYASVPRTKTTFSVKATDTFNYRYLAALPEEKLIESLVPPAVKSSFGRTQVSSSILTLEEDSMLPVKQRAALFKEPFESLSYLLPKSPLGSYSSKPSFYSPQSSNNDCFSPPEPAVKKMTSQERMSFRDRRKYFEKEIHQQSHEESSNDGESLGRRKKISLVSAQDLNTIKREEEKKYGTLSKDEIRKSINYVEDDEDVVDDLTELSSNIHPNSTVVIEGKEYKVEKKPPKLSARERLNPQFNQPATTSSEEDLIKSLEHDVETASHVIEGDVDDNERLKTTSPDVKREPLHDLSPSERRSLEAEKRKQWRQARKEALQNDIIMYNTLKTRRAHSHNSTASVSYVSEERVERLKSLEADALQAQVMLEQPGTNSS